MIPNFGAKQLQNQPNAKLKPNTKRLAPSTLSASITINNKFEVKRKLTEGQVLRF
jgi:hypothetical protein